MTFPQLFQKAGYQTAMFGKLHFGNNPKGIDDFLILPGQGDYINPRFLGRDRDTIITGYVTDVITDLTLNWFKTKRDKNKPFLTFYLHKAPHRAWWPSPEKFAEFYNKEFPEPETLYDDYSGRGNAAKTAEMNLLTHMQYMQDSKVRPSVFEIMKNVEPKILKQLPDDGDIYYAGTADKLTTALENMKGSFLLAIVILYLLMSAMFRSFKDSLLVVLVIPLAAFGGILALNLMNFITFQAMDLLTMIGFIILLGLVVNNAILLVYQARTAERRGLTRRDAVEEAILLRLRPIMMSTLTSIFGMLPLIIIPGAGTELYRGLATVIVGGMMVSTLFTLILLPSLLRIGEDKL